MKRKVLILLTAAWMLGMPQMNAQDIQRTGIEQEQKEVVILVNESSIRIKNADKLLLEIYNMAGVKVVSYRIEGSDKTYDLNNLPKGCYIVKIGKVARKVYLR